MTPFFPQHNDFPSLKSTKQAYYAKLYFNITVSGRGSHINLFYIIVSSQKTLHETNLKCMLYLDEPKSFALPMDAKQEE